VARYARGDDYHVVMKERLHALCDGLRADHPDSELRAFVDTAPVLEREHAARAGLGWIGKHTLLIHPRLGSWMLLGGVLTTLDLAPPPEQGSVNDHCGACTRCIDACPTGAISPYSVDGSRCISYLTIERRGPVDPVLAPLIGDRIFGCDVCQEVCPHNSARSAPPNADALVRDDYAPRRPILDAEAVTGWSAADRARELSGSALKRATLDMIKRNAAIVIRNSGA
jgi:epoxyqueuosine reductase